MTPADTIIETIKAAIQKHYREYNALFLSGSEVGEYYGRGQLEGLANGLYPFFELLDAASQKKLEEALTPQEWSFLTVWGER